MLRHRARANSLVRARRLDVPAVRPGPRPGQEVEEEQPVDGYLVLVRMVLGDRSKADRLIALEAARMPDASRTQCIDNAIERLRRDLAR